MSLSKITLAGRCACGFANYTVALPANVKSIFRCNCTYCTRFGFAGVKPPKEDFKLISPKSKEELHEYKHRHFCPTCSVIIFSEGSYPYKGETIYHFSVNAATINQPQEGLDLSNLKVEYCDGLNDNWEAATQDKPFPGGLP